MCKTRASFIRKKNAATTIQVWYRAAIARRREREKLANMKHSAILIQSWYRGVQCRRKLNNCTQAAAVVEKNIKGYIQRGYFMNQRQAALSIQSYWRNYKLTKSVQSQYIKQKEAAVIIQNCVRTVLLEKKFKKLRNTVICLQSLIRVQQVKRNAKRKRDAVVKIQRRWKATVQARITRGEFTVQKESMYNSPICSQNVHNQKEIHCYEGRFHQTSSYMQNENTPTQVFTTETCSCHYPVESKGVLHGEKIETRMPDEECSSDYDTDTLESL